MPATMPTKQFLTSSDVARAIGSCRNTVKKMVEQGIIKGLRTPGKHLRIPASELERILKPIQDCRSEEMAS